MSGNDVAHGSIQELVKQYVDQTGRDDFGARATTLGQLETVHPANEADWLCLKQFHSARGSKIWAEIVTRQFLTREPNNVAARLSLAEQAADVRATRHVALDEIKRLLQQCSLTSAELVRIGIIYQRCDDMTEARKLFEKAKRTDLLNLELRVLLIHCFINGTELRAAKKELKELRRANAMNARFLVTLMTLAQRCKYYKFIEETIKILLPLYATLDEQSKVNAVVATAGMSVTRQITELVEGLDVTLIKAPDIRKAVMTALEGRGFGTQLAILAKQP